MTSGARVARYVRGEGRALSPRPGAGATPMVRIVHPGYAAAMQISRHRLRPMAPEDRTHQSIAGAMLAATGVASGRWPARHARDMPPPPMRCAHDRVPFCPPGPRPPDRRPPVARPETPRDAGRRDR